MVADRNTKKVLGVSMHGMNAAEVIQEAAMGLSFRCEYRRLRPHATRLSNHVGGLKTSRAVVHKRRVKNELLCRIEECPDGIASTIL